MIKEYLIIFFSLSLQSQKWNVMRTQISFTKCSDGLRVGTFINAPLRQDDNRDDPPQTHTHALSLPPPFVARGASIQGAFEVASGRPWSVPKGQRL